MVVRVTGLDIFLSTVEYGLRRQQLCKDAANRPDVWKEKPPNPDKGLHLCTGMPLSESDARFSPMALV